MPCMTSCNGRQSCIELFSARCSRCITADHQQLWAKTAVRLMTDARSGGTVFTSSIWTSAASGCSSAMRLKSSNLKPPPSHGAMSTSRLSLRRLQALRTTGKKDSSLMSRHLHIGAEQIALGLWLLDASMPVTARVVATSPAVHQSVHSNGWRAAALLSHTQAAMPRRRSRGMPHRRKSAWVTSGKRSPSDRWHDSALYWSS